MGEFENGQDNRARFSHALTNLVDVVAKGRAALVASHNLASIEFDVLTLFLSREELTVSDIARSLPVSPSRVSRVVTQLVELNLLRRRRSRSDRRVVKLTLTEQGTYFAHHLQNRSLDYDEVIAEGIGEEEMARFVETSAKIVSNFAKLVRR